MGKARSRCPVSRTSYVTAVNGAPCLVLAWLFVWNAFSGDPMGWWSISFAQTFVLIPIIVYFSEKGAYCG